MSEGPGDYTMASSRADFGEKPLRFRALPGIWDIYKESFNIIIVILVALVKERNKQHNIASATIGG